MVRLKKSSAFEAKNLPMKEKKTFNKLKQQEWEVRRNLIMDAAQRVFASETFNKANMREIAREANISPGSIYNYFENQEELFLAASLRGADRLIKVFSDLVAEDHPSIQTAAVAYIDFISKNYEYLRMVQHSMLYTQFTSQESIDQLVETARKLFEQFDMIIQQYISSGNVRKFSHLFFVALNGILFSYGRFPDRTSDEVLTYMKELASLLGELLEKYQPK